MFEGLTTDQYCLIIGTLFVAYAVKGASSFGPSLISVPLLTLVWPHPAVFIPSLAVLNLGGNVVLLSRFRKHVDWRIVGFLVGGTVIGVPIGILLLRILSISTLQALVGLGVFIAMPVALGKKFKGPVREVHGVFAGILSGLFGGSIGIDGPPYILFLAAYFPDDPDKRYATTVAAFLLGCIVRVGGFAISGMLTTDGLFAVLFALPLLLAGLAVGTHIFKKLSRKGFDQMVGVLLVVLGGGVLIRALWG